MLRLFFDFSKNFCYNNYRKLRKEFSYVFGISKSSFDYYETLCGL